MCRNLITDDTSSHIDLFNNCRASGTSKYTLERPIFRYVPGNSASLSQANEYLYIALYRDSAGCSCEEIHRGEVL